MTAPGNEKETISASIIVGITGRESPAGQRTGCPPGHRGNSRRDRSTISGNAKGAADGLAEGADRIAADEAGSRPHWNIVAALPLEPDLYCQDFDTKDSVAAFRAHLAAPRTRVFTLPTLMDENGSSPYDVAELQRNPGASNPARTLHYEQVGLYIANAATILVAVMADNEQLRQDRRHGADRTISRKWLVGRNRRETSCCAAGYCRPRRRSDMVRAGLYWLVDLDALSTEQSSGAAAFTVRDGSREQGGRPGARLGLKSRRRHRPASSIAARWPLPPTRSRPVPRTPRSICATSVPGCPKYRATTPNGRAARHSGFPSCSSWQWRPGRSLSSTSKSSVARPASPSMLPLSPPRSFSISSPAAFSGNRLRRTIAPLPRRCVSRSPGGRQGLDGAAQHRVDNYYLERATGSLGLVRAAVRAMINSALFASAPPGRVPDSESSWIGGQIRFFHERIDQRRFRLILVELGSWSLFLSSLGAAVFLLLVTISDHYFDKFHASRVAPAMFAIAGASVVAFCLVALLQPRLLMSSTNQRKPLLKGLDFPAGALPSSAWCSLPACITCRQSLENRRGMGRDRPHRLRDVRRRRPLCGGEAVLGGGIARVRGRARCIPDGQVGPGRPRGEQSVRRSTGRASQGSHFFFSDARHFWPRTRAGCAAHRERPLEPVYWSGATAAARPDGSASRPGTARALLQRALCRQLPRRE